ncbi:glycosyltransferase [Cellulosilyticum sp. WCF-2]|uniref:glycosyltransferase n=1 Tax=Cellulosilyticum sp. WCF-2 TaxID=2497860 RepID=UPI000F8D89C6|nr:glycosyltransferase family 2 protein [Cellulosilyticum sp. WCF-2]QEH67816.1 glycosyltransferase family 2 protein [Cellulosilyticum sp. WCF-2]
MIILFWILELTILYDIIISFFSFKKRNIPIEYVLNRTATFTVLIACHNEEQVIVDNLLALYNSDYDRQLFHVVVIADNCTDKTEILCHQFKEKNPDFNMTVVPVKGGSKPKALNAGIDYLKQHNLWNNQYIVILDADNKVSPQMLTAFNYYHQEFDILQCRICSANDESFVARSFTTAFNRTTYDRQIARNNIGLSASLSGTGFSIDQKVFDEVDFQHCTTLTEDLEFSVLSILKGYKIKFVEEQYVLNQHLDGWVPSIVQRVRWCRGHMQVSVKLTGKLIRECIKKPSLQLVDTFLFINTPIRVLLFTIIGIYILITKTYISLLFISISILIFIYTIFYTIYCNKYDISYILNQFHYAICMYFAIVYGTLTYKSTVWVKTKHKKITGISKAPENTSDKI